MKKLLGLLLVMTMAWPVSADVLKNVDLKGEIETIASDVRHHISNHYTHGTNTRVLAGLSAELVEDVRANVLFQYVTAWDGAMSGDTVQQYWDTVRLTEANVVLSNLFDCFEATVGRQFYGDEDSAVMYFGPNHYNAESAFLAAKSLDAVKLTYSDDFKAFTMIAGKVADELVDTDVAEQLAAGANRADLNLNGAAVYGADLRMNLTEVLGLQVYGYDFRNVSRFNHNGVAYEADAGLYGAKLTFNPEAALLSVEYARNFSGNRLVKEGHDTGYMLKADAGMGLTDAVDVRGTFLYAKEGFIAFGNYTPGLLIGHALGGDIFAYSNEGVRMFNLGFDYNATETWTFSLDGYAFQGRNGHHAATWEADLTAKYTHNEYVQLFAGIGYAKYGNEQVGQFNKVDYGRDNTKGQIGMLVNF